MANNWEIYTPPHLIAELFDGFDVNGKFVFDPAAGDGRLLYAALERGASAAAGIDINPKDPLVQNIDALTTPWPGCDAIVGNPPWKRGWSADPETKAAAAKITGSRGIDISIAWIVLALEANIPFRLYVPLAALRGRGEENLAQHTQRIGRGYKVLREFLWLGVGAKAEAALIEGGPGFPPVFVPPCPTPDIQLTPGVYPYSFKMGELPMIGGYTKHTLPGSHGFLIPPGVSTVLFPKSWPKSGVPVLQNFPAVDYSVVVVNSYPIEPGQEDKVFDPVFREWVLRHSPQLPGVGYRVTLENLTGRKRQTY